MSDSGVTLVLSDLHLGKGPCREALLQPLLEGVDRLVLNGDSAEMHLPGAVDAARRELESFGESCRRRGIELLLIEGNHDLGISPRRHALLRGGRVLITHGDAFDPCVAPWAPWAADARAAVARALAAFPSEERASLEACFAAARAAAECEWSDPERAKRHASALSLCLRPRAIASVLAYWRRYPGLAANFAERFAPSAQVIICGHSHRPGAWRIRGRVVLNTGHFEFPAKPHAVRLEGDRVELLPLVRTRRGYSLGASARCRLTLAAASRSAAASMPLSMPLPESR